MNDYFARIVHPESVGQPATITPLESSRPAGFGADMATDDIVELDFESLPQPAEATTPRPSAVPLSEPAQRTGSHSPDAIDMPDHMRARTAPPQQRPDPARPSTRAALPDEEARIDHPARAPSTALAHHMTQAPDSAPATLSSPAAPQARVPEVSATLAPEFNTAPSPPPSEARVAFEHALRWVRSAPVNQDENETDTAHSRSSFSLGVTATDPPIRAAGAAGQSTQTWPPEHPPAKRTSRQPPPAALEQSRVSDSIVEEDTVMLSIGAIHVRLEAPQAASTARPEPPRRTDPAPGAPARTTLATGLRRRCIHF